MIFRTLRKFARCTSVCALCLCLLMTAGCGAEESPLQEDVRNYVYRFETVDLTEGDEEGTGGGVSRVGNLFSSGDGFGLFLNRYAVDGSGNVLIRCDASGHVTEEIPLVDPEMSVQEDAAEVYIDAGDFDEAAPQEDVLEVYEDAGGYEGNMSFDSPMEDRSINLFYGEEGRICAVETIRTTDPMTGASGVRYELLEMTESGEIRNRYDLPDPRKDAADDLYVDQLYGLGDGRLLIKSNGGITLWDPERETFRTLYTSNKGWFDESVCVLGDGTVLVGSWEGGDYEVKTLDTKTGKLSGPLDIPQDMRGRTLFPGRTHDCYYFNDRSVFAYDRKKGDVRKVFDGIASDMLVDNVEGILETEDGRLILLATNWYDMGQMQINLYIGTHVPPSEVKDKKEITLSCVFLDSAITRRVVDFNSKSEDYRIRIVDYSRYYSGDDWRAPYTKLNTDLIAGNIPDILVIDNELPLESYISKDILRDLTPFMEQDPELSEAEFMTNVFDAYRVDGKLYQLIPSFYLYTGIIYTKDLGDRTTLTMQDFYDICEERDVAVRDSFGGMTRDDLLQMLLYMQGADYIDLSTGKCAFDSPEFRDLLTLVKQFPKKGNDDDYLEQQKAYREGRAILQMSGFGDFSDYLQARYGTFGDDITMIGIPASAGSGSVIQPSMQLGITTSAKDPEAVWSFVRQLLLPEYQDSLDWSFPVRMDSLHKHAEKAKERPYFINEKGQKEEYDRTWYMGGVEIVIPTLRDDEEEKVIDFLKKCDRRVYNNSTVNNIITEEAAAFFDGQKTVEEVTKIIQSRAQIYVHENR